MDKVFVIVKGKLKRLGQNLDLTGKRCVHGYIITNEAAQRKLGATMEQYIKTLLESISRFHYCWVDFMARPISEGSIVKNHPLGIMVLPE